MAGGTIVERMVRRVFVGEVIARSEKEYAR